MSLTLQTLTACKLTCHEKNSWQVKNLLLLHFSMHERIFVFLDVQTAIMFARNYLTKQLFNPVILS
ncbi:hypothetical protein BHG07_00220 [Brenneria salicis ATCC 15712 = DSM 30166]|nr:hypothetical protein BHG07_00220 [Brenneria salicis ATCC 15712 = DSM 30166]